MVKIKPSNTTSTVSKNRRRVDVDILGKPKIIVIVGPTASGKSDLAIQLARKFNGEIISADSRQVYRRMDIGTGKVSKDRSRNYELGIRNEYYSNGIRHHLIDVANPKRIFSVAQFQKLAQRAIKNILKRNKLPIIVGGTGQYIDTLIYNFSLPEVPPNYKLRTKLEKQTPEQLFARLQKLDPERAQNIDRHNPRRLIRAIEIVIATGQPVGQIKKQSPYDVLWLGLNPKNLDQRISARLSARFKQGLIAEVKKLRANGISWQRLHNLGLGYRIILEYLKGNTSLTETKKLVTLSEIQYSKRQMTWFKRNKEIRWLKTEKNAEKLTRAFV